MSKKVCSITKSSISELPDDLLLKILSFLSTKQAVVTSILSKQWKSLWTKVPRLEYIVQDHKDETSFEQFIDKSLLLHNSNVLESLYIKLSSRVHVYGPWISRVLHHHHCHLRELEIDASILYIALPHELFTCKTLVVLKLKGELIDVEALTTVCLPSLKVLHTDHSSCLFKCESLQMLLSNCNFLTDLMVIRRLNFRVLVKFDVSWCKTLVSLKLKGLNDISISSSSDVCLPFLNTLHVERIVNLDNDSLCRLLSNCPLLSDLTLEEKTSDVILDLDIIMPCLQRLSIIGEAIDFKHLCSLLEKYIQKLAIIAPSFQYFSIIDSFSPPFTPFYVRVRFGDLSKLEYTSIFHRIVHLELSFCLCSEKSGEMLVDLLLCFTKLVVLSLKNVDKLFSLDHWDTPSFVPECLLTSLEALEWRGYTGRTRDKGMLSYLLNHSLCLKTAKIVSDLEEKEQSMEDLASMPRGSQSCQLVLK